ncbi:cell division site-positioning protein MapZ family protein [Streptococcus halichoeri]|uniref:cell division site-positioning protein MapZ family protein n=1 Tax=Streptococcus halichoeri TaxID=254785 RepID=UPI0013589CA9|nr:cell division site-positioning protein MapZ family protein [Streptococcus halichoeri]
MSEDTKDFEQEEQESLAIDDAKHLTVGEAVRKESEIKAGVTEDDSILDKYIKQHRDEVASQKFETKAAEMEALDTASLDKFIEKQRQELAKYTESKVADQQAQAAQETSPTDGEQPNHHDTANEEKEAIVAAQTPVTEDLLVEEAPVIVPGPTENLVVPSHFDEPHSDEDHPFKDETPKKNPKKGLLVALLALLLLVLAVAFGLNVLKQKNSAPSTKQSQTSVKEISKISKNKANAQAFEKSYASFFLDKNQTKLKNDMFDHLPQLTTQLAKLKGTAYYESANQKVDQLKKQIAAIQAVNGKFSSQAIKNGEKVTASVKSDANFDDLKADQLKTGNATLDSLLQSVITDGRNQLKQKSETAKAAQAAKTAAQADKAEAANTDSQPGGQEAGPQANQAQVTPNPTGSVTIVGNGASYSHLERNLSRVPYNQGLIADRTNPAWAFNPGVLERIVATSQARGYISGNNYILDPVNIINGNGYYNMFKPDGTYLFSLNCKTGYFVGNAPGHADALDY